MTWNGSFWKAWLQGEEDAKKKEEDSLDIRMVKEKRSQMENFKVVPDNKPKPNK